MIAGAASGSLAGHHQLNGAINVHQLPQVPAKRKWLHGTDLARGAVSLLVAPGGRGKSSWLIALSLACASGKPLLGAHIFGGPLRVLLLNAEDSTNEIALRLRAAMQHHGLTDNDVAGLHVAGADRLGLSLLRVEGKAASLDQKGWAALIAEIDAVRPDVIILDPLVSLMGGASTNDNAVAALLMGQLVALTSRRGLGVMVAHHAAKGREPTSAESAMGAASFVNLARIALGIEPIADKDAGRVGLAPWEAKSVFRVIGTKQNLRPPDETDRLFRLVSIEMSNAEPPVYPNADRVAVVEEFTPGTSSPAFSPALIRDALQAVTAATPPLSPSARAGARYAVPMLVRAIDPHRGGRATEDDAKAVLDHIVRAGLVVVQTVKLTRPGGRSDNRDGLVLTREGKKAAGGTPQGISDAPPADHLPQAPQSPATVMRDDAGRGPPGPPATP
jgi:hypothetical protein